MFTKTVSGETKTILALLGMDAKVQEMPRMLKSCKWRQVKEFFEIEVKKLTIKTD